MGRLPCKKNACINGKAEIVGPEESTELDSLLSLHLHSIIHHGVGDQSNPIHGQRQSGQQAIKTLSNLFFLNPIIYCSKRKQTIDRAFFHFPWSNTLVCKTTPPPSFPLGLQDLPLPLFKPKR